MVGQTWRRWLAVVGSLVGVLLVVADAVVDTAARLLLGLALLTAGLGLDNW